MSLVTPGGQVREVAGDIAFPNGMAVTADNSTLIVAEGGAVRQVVELDRGGFACALGGPGRTTLFVTAAEWRGMSQPEMVGPGSGQVVMTSVDVPGAGWP